MAALLVIGGGLAGCEAAWQLARRGHEVTLVEMRPVRSTPAHRTAELAELVCTNSFKSEDPGHAHGLLKAEMRDLGSLLLQAAEEARVPAGAALAVDRAVFAAEVSRRIAGHPRITVERREITQLPAAPAIIATGPLTSPALAAEISALLEDRGLAFYDSIAPIVAHDSIDLSVAFYASRWGRGDGTDYLNCPLDRVQYYRFIEQLTAADVYPGHEWEDLPHLGQPGAAPGPEPGGDVAVPGPEPGGGVAAPGPEPGADVAAPGPEPGEAGEEIPYFEGCLPIEVMAARGPDTLRFGPMRPIGLRDPHTGRRPFAVVQLRREDASGQMWNMVGFQTRLRTGEQRRVFRTIPGLEHAEFLRTGSIHRNTYLNFPATLLPHGAPRARPDLLFTGQLTGVEGYMESAASGILAGINLDRIVRGRPPLLPPVTTMMGGLARYLREADPGRFQPMNSNFGLLGSLPGVVPKDERRARLVERARRDFAAWVASEDVACEGVPA